MEVRDFRPGLYKHFKLGTVYFAIELMLDEEDVVRVRYCNALAPTKWFTRPLAEFSTDVSSRKDNLTGQTFRFERISSLTFNTHDLSTGQLLRELSTREDSPLYGSDIECLSSALTCSDYCVGVYEEATEDAGAGVYPLATFETKEEAFKSPALTTSHRANVYKRTYLIQED